MKLRIWKCDAQGDTVYIEAATKADAEARLRSVLGDIPSSLLTWTEVKKLPDGEEFL